jgi:PKD repeat protein
MRTTTHVSLLGAAALVILAGCTVKDVDQPELAGPSTFAHQITMVADRDALTQNGVDSANIRITALGPNGQSENIALQAQVFVDGVAQDFGTLDNKFPITPATIRYTAPPASPLAAGQVPTTVTIAVTPTRCASPPSCSDIGTDSRGEIARQIDIRLQPQGIILPTNPNLVAAFTVTPASPKVLETTVFDASTTTNSGAACGVACTYSWNFGDGTTGSGLSTTHQFRTINTFTVTLTVTDARGATAVASRTVTVAPGDPPSATFTTSPTSPGINQDVFFDATASRPATGRTITNYDWAFGDGSTGTGVVTTHQFTAPGNYQVKLTTTDDAGTKSPTTTTALQVGPSVGPQPTASMTCTQGNSTRGVPVSCNASASTPGSGSNIVSYTFNWGVGAGDEVHTNPVQSHLYTSPGTFTVTMTVRDSVGRTAVNQQTVTVVATP